METHLTSVVQIDFQKIGISWIGGDKSAQTRFAPLVIGAPALNCISETKTSNALNAKKS